MNGFSHSSELSQRTCAGTIPTVSGAIPSEISSGAEEEEEKELKREVEEDKLCIHIKGSEEHPRYLLHGYCNIPAGGVNLTPTGHRTKSTDTLSNETCFSVFNTKRSVAFCGSSKLQCTI